MGLVSSLLRTGGLKKAFVCGKGELSGEKIGV